MVEEIGYVSIAPVLEVGCQFRLRQYVDIGPGPNSHTWGAVLLSKVSQNTFYESFNTLTSDPMRLVPHNKFDAPSPSFP